MENNKLEDSPIHACAKEYWVSLVDHYQRKHVPWAIPMSWDELTDEMKSTTLLRIYAHIKEPGIPEHIEHHDWVALKFNAGYRFGDYNNHGPDKSHPMLRQFDDCPKWFQDVTGIFCSTVRLWTPTMIKYWSDINESR